MSRPISVRLLSTLLAIPGFAGGAPAETANTDSAPPAVMPLTETVSMSARFNYEAPAHSLTILRIPGR